jgi:predicted HTH transcriptional regulator
MTEPWNIKTDDKRPEDSLPTFIIFCEDEVSEPVYFKSFETPLIKVNPIGKKKSKTHNVISALAHCRENGLMEGVLENERLKEGNIKVWCVFDMDKDKAVPAEIKINVDFDKSISTANSCGIDVAWSNDSFELWVLMHFEDVPKNNKDYQSRKTYYKRLTEIFKAHPRPSEDLKKCLKHASFSYEKDLKSEKNFRSIVRTEMIGKTGEAIRRAQELKTYHFGVQTHFHEKSPCTMVHNLVEELIRQGHFDIPGFNSSNTVTSTTSI